MTQKIRYFNLQKEKRAQAEIDAVLSLPKARHFDFFLDRNSEASVRKKPRREHVVAADVARITEMTLKGKSYTYYKQLMAWRPDLAFKHQDQCKIIDDMPHLGYTAITSGTIPDQDENNVPWILYFANFNARFGKDDVLFEHIPMAYGVTFFALALTMNEKGNIIGRDLRKRGNGLLFSTQDPTEAFESIVKLREVQKLWQQVVYQRERESATSFLIGGIDGASTSTEILLPPTKAPGPEDLRQLLFTA